MRINKTFVDQVALPCIPNGAKQAQKFYRDSAIPGFALRVMNTGAKSFIVEKRIDGKVKRITLGRYGNLTVEQARKKALELLGKVATGHNPIQEKKEDRLKAFSLQDTFNDYLLTRKDLRESTIKDYTRSLREGCPAWLDKPLMNITKDMIEIRHRELGKTSKARANNTMRVLRALFNHAKNKFEDATGNPLILINPVDRLSQNRAWYKIQRRRTLIKPHQLKPWYLATLELNTETTRDYLHFLLFTGLRRSEASKLRWCDIDFSELVFSILETKNGCIHTLPFSSFTEDLLRRRYVQRESLHVFPSDSDLGYLVEPKFSVARVSEISEVSFTLHDLRRTFITMAESLDIPGYALKRLLNHKDPNDVTAGYIVSDVGRLRKPMQMICDYILSQLSDDILPLDDAQNDNVREYLKLVN